MENRRSRNNVIETHKIVNRNYSINRDLFFLDIDDMGLRGYDSKLFKRRFRLDVRKFVLCNRCILKICCGSLHARIRQELLPRVYQRAVFSQNLSQFCVVIEDAGGVIAVVMYQTGAGQEERGCGGVHTDNTSLQHGYTHWTVHTSETSSYFTV